MKSGRSGALKPDRLGLSCRATKCSDAGTGDLGMLTAHETCRLNPTRANAITSTNKLPLKHPQRPSLSYAINQRCGYKPHLFIFTLCILLAMATRAGPSFTSQHIPASIEAPQEGATTQRRIANPCTPRYQCSSPILLLFVIRQDLFLSTVGTSNVDQQ